MNGTALETVLACGDPPAAVTMDVFDTALTRCWAQPRHAFLACATRLRARGLTLVDDESWMRMRQQAEAQAAQRCGPELATLADIYEGLATDAGWSAADTAAACAIEFDVELESARALPLTLMVCEQVVREGLPLRFLSDMYLREADVAKLLQQVGYRISADQVWVSSQRQASKRHGTLFALALAAWQHLPAAKVLHIGDNTESDVRRARSAGLRALQLDDARLPASASRLLGVDEAPLLLRSLVAGAVRLARLQMPAHAAPRSGLWQLGSSHAGPLLSLYVWWLLSHAQQHGVKRLYFLARDGQVLLDIARVLQSAGIGTGIELRYLHASRQAWFAPSVTRWSEDDLFRLLDEPDQLNDVPKLARRMGFSGADALKSRWPEVAPALAPTMTNQEVAKALVRHVTGEAGLAHTTRLRDDALAYFEDQGLLDGTPWAIVDLGWRGRMQECLGRIVQAHPRGAKTSAAGYYLGLVEPPRDLPPGWQAHAFSSQAGSSHLPGPAHLLELMCEANHGTTQGYARDANGVVQPVFEAQLDSKMSAWGLMTYREAVLCYATQLANSLPLLHQTLVAPRALLALTQAIGREFFSRAEPTAACAFAQMPCSHSVNHDDVHDLAPALGRLDAWCRALTLGRLQLSGRRTHWLPGSLARSGAAAYRAYLALHKVASRLRR